MHKPRKKRGLPKYGPGDKVKAPVDLLAPLNPQDFMSQVPASDMPEAAPVRMQNTVKDDKRFKVLASTQKNTGTGLNSRVKAQRDLAQQQGPTQNYMVVDKNVDSAFYFNPQGQLIAGEPVVTGASGRDTDVGLSMKNWMAQTGNSSHEDYFKYLEGIQAQTTPAGTFKVSSVRKNTADNPDLKGELFNSVFRPERNEQIRKGRIRDYGRQQTMLTLESVSGVPQSKAVHGTANSVREVALANPGSNRHLSNGCINVNGETICFDAMEKGSNVFVLPEESGGTAPMAKTGVVPANAKHYVDTRTNVANALYQRGIKASQDAVNFVSAVTQKETQGGTSLVGRMETVLPLVSKTTGAFQINPKSFKKYLPEGYDKPGDFGADAEAAYNFFQTHSGKKSVRDMYRLYSGDKRGKYDQRFKTIYDRMKTVYAGGGVVKYPGGGNIPVEVEGGEMAETPQGEIMKFTGPSHENGGVPVALPENTEIYSKRIKINGESMADRKASRERKMNRLTNLFAKDPTNPLAQNTTKRTAHNIMLQEQMDRAIMEQASPVLKGRNPQLADPSEMPGAGMQTQSDPTQPQPLSDSIDQQMPQYGFGGAALSGVGSGPSTGSSFNGGGVGRRVGGMGGGVAAGAASTAGGGFEFNEEGIAALPWASLGTGIADIATQLAHGKYDEVDSPLLAETEFLRPYAGGGKAKHWIQGAVNPDHKGYCTPMTKSTCTPRRKAFAKTMKKHHGFHAGGGEVQIPQEVLNSVGNPYLIPGTGPSVYNPSANTVNYNQFSPEDIPHELGHAYQNSQGQLSDIAVPPANQSVVRSFDPGYYHKRGDEHNEMMGVIYDHLGEMGQFVPPELVANRANDALYRRDYTAEGDAELTLAPQIRKAIKSHSKYAGGGKTKALDPEMVAISNVLSQKNRNLNWVQRGLNPENYPSLTNPETGEPMTHMLSYGDDEQGYYVYPNVIQNESGQLQDLDPDEAHGWARDSNTIMRVPSKKVAKFYSKQGLIRHPGQSQYAGGGSVSYQVGDEMNISPSEIKRLKKLGYEFE